MCKVINPIIKVVSAFITNVDQVPANKRDVKQSRTSGLYTVNNSMQITIGTKLRFKSCLDHSHTSVAVVICCT